MTTQDFTEIASFEAQMMSEAMRLCTEARIDFHLQFFDSTGSFGIQVGDMIVSPMYRQCVDEADDAQFDPLCSSQLVWGLEQYKPLDAAPHEDAFDRGGGHGEEYTVLHTAPAECLSEILSVLCNVITARIEKAHNHAD